MVSSAIQSIHDSSEEGWSPGKSIKALLDKVSEVKFSRHTILSIILLSMVWTCYRSQHWMRSTFGVDGWVALPTAIFIEAIIVAGAAATFGALRDQFIADLKNQDQTRAKYAVYLSILCLVIGFVALSMVAWNDAIKTTGTYAPAIVMSLAQVAQMIFVTTFIVSADLEEREDLRIQWEDYKKKLAASQKQTEANQRQKIEQDAQKEANQCPYCFRSVAPNNRKRHVTSCSQNPVNKGAI